MFISLTFDKTVEYWDLVVGIIQLTFLILCSDFLIKLRNSGRIYFISLFLLPGNKRQLICLEFDKLRFLIFLNLKNFSTIGLPK